MASSVCKWAKVPYGENFVKILAVPDIAAGWQPQPLDSVGARWFSVQGMIRMQS